MDINKEEVELILNEGRGCRVKYVGTLKRETPAEASGWFRAKFIDPLLPAEAVLRVTEALLKEGLFPVFEDFKLKKNTVKAEEAVFYLQPIPEFGGLTNFWQALATYAYIVIVKSIPEAAQRLQLSSSGLPFLSDKFIAGKPEAYFEFNASETQPHRLAIIEFSLKQLSSSDLLAHFMNDKTFVSIGGNEYRVLAIQGDSLYVTWKQGASLKYLKDNSIWLPASTFISAANFDSDNFEYTLDIYDVLHIEYLWNEANPKLVAIIEKNITAPALELIELNPKQLIQVRRKTVKDYKMYWHISFLDRLSAKRVCVIADTETEKLAVHVVLDVSGTVYYVLNPIQYSEADLMKLLRLTKVAQHIGNLLKAWAAPKNSM